MRKSTLKETANTTASVQNNIAKTTEKQTVSASTVIVSDMSVINDTTVINSTTTKFSAPDSTGKQYPTEQTMSTSKSWSKKTNDITAKATQNDNSNARSTLSDKSKTKSSANATVDKTTQTKVTVSTWVKLAFVVLGILLLIGAYFALKRYGVITWLITLVSKIK
jgi:thiol:disulfide interchange protein